MTHHRRLVLGYGARAVLFVLALAVAGSLLAGCQPNQPSSSQSSQPSAVGARKPTPEQAVKLVIAFGTYQQAAVLKAALGPWRLRDRVATADRHWRHFQGLVLVLANRAARLELLDLVRAIGSRATASAGSLDVAGSMGALGGRGVLAAPRIVPSPVVRFAEENQCAFVLPGQEPLRRPALRYLASGEAVEEQEPPLGQQLLDLLEADPGPIPMTEAEIQAYEQWSEVDPGPIPMTQEEIDWAEEQRAGGGAPISMTEEEVAAVEAAANDAPPFTEDLLQWIDQYEQDSAPQPMTPEEVAWAEQQAADDGAPIPMTSEEAGWVDEWAETGEPVPMTPEEIAWAEQQRAGNDGAPITMTEAEIQAYEEWVQEGAPVPMTPEEAAQYGEWVDDGAPVPMTPEEIAWVEEHFVQDDSSPVPMTPEEIAALGEWVDDGSPVPMTPEEIAWVEEHFQEDSSPVPMTPEEIAAVEEAARNRTLDLTEDDWDWILRRNGIGSPSTPPPCAWIVDRSFTNATGATGRIKGQKCGAPTGTWVVNGTYDYLGMHGVQQWQIEIGSNGRSGTYSYSTTIDGSLGPVEVHVDGTASGTATLTIRADGTARITFRELAHEYHAEHAYEVAPPDATGAIDWAVGGAC